MATTQTQRNVIKVANPPLEDNIRTLLTADVNSAAVSITILSKTGLFLAQRGAKYYVIINDYDQEGSEIKLVTADDTDNKTLSIAALSNSHSASDPVTFIPYDKIRFYGMATPDATPTLLATVPIDTTQQFTEYVYTGTDYSYFCSAYYNSNDDNISSYSEIIETADFGRTSAKRVIESALKKALTKIDESSNSLLSWDTAISILNDGLDEIMARKRKWIFLHTILSGSNTVAGNENIDIPTNLAYLENLKVNNQRLKWISHFEYDTAVYNSIVQENGKPQYYTIKNGKYALYPKPDSALSVIYEYYAYPTEVEELNDSIPIAFIPALVFYCAAHFCYVRGNDKRGDKMYIFYQKVLEQQVEEFSGPDQLGDAERVEQTNPNFYE